MDATVGHGRRPSEAQIALAQRAANDEEERALLRAHGGMLTAAAQQMRNLPIGEKLRDPANEHGIQHFTRLNSTLNLLFADRWRQDGRTDSDLVGSFLRVLAFIFAAPRTDAQGNLVGIGSVCSGEYCWTSERTAWNHLRQHVPMVANSLLELASHICLGAETGGVGLDLLNLLCYTRATSGWLAGAMGGIPYVTAGAQEAALVALSKLYVSVFRADSQPRSGLRTVIDRLTTYVVSCSENAGTAQQVPAINDATIQWYADNKQRGFMSLDEGARPVRAAHRSSSSSLVLTHAGERKNIQALVQHVWYRDRNLVGPAPPRRVPRAVDRAPSAGASFNGDFHHEQGVESVTAATAAGVRYAPRRPLHQRAPAVPAVVPDAGLRQVGPERLLPPDDPGEERARSRSRSRSNHGRSRSVSRGSSQNGQLRGRLDVPVGGESSVSAEQELAVGAVDHMVREDNMIREDQLVREDLLARGAASAFRGAEDQAPAGLQNPPPFAGMQLPVQNYGVNNLGGPSVGAGFGFVGDGARSRAGSLLTDHVSISEAGGQGDRGARAEHRVGPGRPPQAFREGRSIPLSAVGAHRGNQVPLRRAGSMVSSGFGAASGRAMPAGRVVGRGARPAVGAPRVGLRGSAAGPPRLPVGRPVRSALQELHALAAADYSDGLMRAGRPQSSLANAVAGGARSVVRSAPAARAGSSVVGGGDHPPAPSVMAVDSNGDVRARLPSVIAVDADGVAHARVPPPPVAGDGIRVAGQAAVLSVAMGAPGDEDVRPDPVVGPSPEQNGHVEEVPRRDGGVAVDEDPPRNPEENDRPSSALFGQRMNLEGHAPRRQEPSGRFLPGRSVPPNLVAGARQNARSVRNQHVEGNPFVDPPRREGADRPPPNNGRRMFSEGNASCAIRNGRPPPGGSPGGGSPGGGRPRRSRSRSRNIPNGGSWEMEFDPLVEPAVERYFDLSRLTEAEKTVSLHDLSSRRTAAHEPFKPVKAANPLAYRTIAKLCLGVCGYDIRGNPVTETVVCPPEGSLGDIIGVLSVQEIIRAEVRRLIARGSRPEMSFTLRGISLLALSGYGLHDLRRKLKLPTQLLDSPAGVRVTDLKLLETTLSRAALLMCSNYWPRSVFTLADHALEKLSESIYAVSALAKEAIAGGCELLHSALPELEAAVEDVVKAPLSYGELFVVCAVSHGLSSVMNSAGVPDSEQCRKLASMVNSCNKSKAAFDTRTKASFIVCCAAGMLLAAEQLEANGGLVTNSFFQVSEHDVLLDEVRDVLCNKFAKKPKVSPPPDNAKGRKNGGGGAGAGGGADVSKDTAPGGHGGKGAVAAPTTTAKNQISPHPGRSWLEQCCGQDFSAKESHAAQWCPKDLACFVIDPTRNNDPAVVAALGGCVWDDKTTIRKCPGDPQKCGWEHKEGAKSASAKALIAKINETIKKEGSKMAARTEEWSTRWKAGDFDFAKKTGGGGKGFQQKKTVK